MKFRTRTVICALLCTCLFIAVAVASDNSDGTRSDRRRQQTASDGADESFEPCGIAPDALSKLTAWLHSASTDVDGIEGDRVPFPFDDIVFACSDVEKAAGVAVCQIHASMRIDRMFNSIDLCLCVCYIQGALGGAAAGHAAGGSFGAWLGAEIAGDAGRVHGERFGALLGSAVGGMCIFGISIFHEV